MRDKGLKLDDYEVSHTVCEFHLVTRWNGEGVPKDPEGS